MLNKILQVLESNWGNYIEDQRPIDSKIQKFINDGMINPLKINVYTLINLFAKEFCKNGVYLEVGTHRGSSLLAAAWDNPTARCIGIDHFAKHHRPEEDIERQLKDNILKYDVDNVEYFRMEALQGIDYIFSKEPELRIDMFFYDAEHEYKPQMTIMEKMIAHLSEECLICVDDLTLAGTKEGIDKFCERHKEFEPFIIDSCNWWNGWAILYRDKEVS